ncbi:MAG TPA: cupin domain-containing protein [Rhodanobacteraceae bacterium]|nr:cupin domain-containing protein [Rhodanobacteraceae bacterium]
MIEVCANAKELLGMPPARFLRDCWQRRPLLVRRAFPAFADPLTPNDLAGLACEPSALARIVAHDAKRDRWTLRTGPFAPADFGKLPKRDWTLLVQDVDKWDADVRALLACFGFLPNWRIDDVMISYAVDGGSVGAHVDQYDVFLLQGLGQRRWSISTDPGAPMAFRDDADIKLLREFAPTDSWVLGPGDMLYLPPGVPHHGVAIGECLTYSIGMRAPSRAELLVDFAETFAAGWPEDERFGDADLAPTDGHGEIDDAAFARVLRAMPWLRVSPAPKEGARRATETDAGPGAIDASMFRAWFASYITRYRSTLAAVPRARRIADAELARRAAHDADAVRNPWSRAAWFRSGRDARLFVSGAEFACSVAFARLIGTGAPFPLARIVAARDRRVLRALVDAGHLSLSAAHRSRR